MPTEIDILPATGLTGEPSASSRMGEVALNRLMDRYAQGEDALFRDLHEHLAPRISRFLLRLCGSPSITEELAQEAFLRIHRARGSFNRGGPALPWIYAVTRNVYLDYERRRKALGAAGVDDEAAEIPEASARRPDSLLEARQELALVRQALERMPVSQREAFVLLRFEGLSVSDAAEVLGTTEASVKSRAFRAYEAIRLATRRAEEGQER